MHTSTACVLSQSSGADNTATRNVAAPASEAAAVTASSAAASGRQSALHREPGIRAKLLQVFVDREAVLYPPALQYEHPTWKDNAIHICNDWINDQIRKNRLLRTSALDCTASTGIPQDSLEHIESACEFSRMLALAYESKHRKDLQQKAGGLLLPVVQDAKRDYRDEIVKAFLRAVGVENVDAVLDSFKNTGSGALHRHDSTFLSTLTNLLGALQLLIPEPVGKVIVSGFRLGALLVTTNAVVESGEHRLRNAGTEDALTLGRAEAAKSAKHAPNVLQASWSVLRQLRNIEKDLKELEAALGNLGDPGADAPGNTQEARDALNLVLARICHKLVVKSRYKAAKENAAVEFRGNERNLYTGSAGTFLTVAASGIAILTPEFIAGAISGGLLAGATTTALLLYLGYQLSNGPSKDGEAKARRAIIALAKLTEVLDPTQEERIRLRANAYEEYLKAHKKTPRFNATGNDAAAPRDPKQTLLDALNEIAMAEKRPHDASGRLDNAQENAGRVNGVSPLANWEAYRAYQAEMANANANESQPPEAKAAALQSQKQSFYKSHASKLATDPLIHGWKTQIEIKMNTTHRLLKGKVARAHKHLLREQKTAEAETSDSWPSRMTSLQNHMPAMVKDYLERHKPMRQQRLDDVKRDLKQALSDLVFFELAYNQMKARGNAVSEDMARIAGAAFAKIQDGDVHALFTGDSREQVRVTHLAKKLTEGEAKRYTLLNLGANAITLGIGAALQVADLQITADKANGTYVGPRVLDFKLAAVLSMNATPSAPLTTGDRTPFLNRALQPLLQTIEPRRSAKEAVPLMELAMHSIPANETANTPARAGTSSERNVRSALSAATVPAASHGITEEPRIVPAVPHLSADETQNDLAGQLEKFDAILDVQTEQMIEVMAKMKFVPDELHLQFDATEDAAETSANASTIKIDMSSTAAFHRVRYKNAKPQQQLRYILGEVKIAAKQSALVFFGLPAQAAAQVPLRRTRAAVNSAPDKIARAEKALTESIASDTPRQPTPDRTSRRSNSVRSAAEAVSGTERKSAHADRPEQSNSSLALTHAQATSSASPAQAPNAIEDGPPTLPPLNFGDSFKFDLSSNIPSA